ncbi:MAG: hypothetical protein BWK79_08815 [Beggiatoa sp. IS2]|nr:MAG: hypothetical protein BWK79_08815 [Beggiatoa sp. IS2]
MPALLEDLTGFEKLSGLGRSESELKDIREFSEWGGVHFVNSKILEILIQTIENTMNRTMDNSWHWLNNKCYYLKKDVQK